MKSNEWYTPAKYIEAARATMGGIDLDPASCALANETVKATRYYTKEENGLMLPWSGRIWLNPPYGREYKKTGTTAFVSRLLYDYKEGIIEQACILSMLGMYAHWFFRLLQFPICMLTEKPIFYHPDGTHGKLGFAACCTYLGKNEDSFISHFQQFGPIVKAITQPKPRPLNLELFTEDTYV